jgi:UDP-glucuronate 4-epimerase
VVKHALVTGGCGFIGSHLVESLIADGWKVSIMDVQQFADIRHDYPHSSDYSVVVHLAAKAGVRPSIADPVGYYDTNVNGTLRLLEWAKASGVKQFVFASSSSVYGVNPHVPWREDAELIPASPYAATKIAGEALGRTYARLYGIRFIALRFFTVYGPRQRKDLAIRTFAERMVAGQPITVYGNGRSSRDYTYIDDIVQGIKAAMMVYTGNAFEVFNLGNTHPISLRQMVAELERVLGVKARINRQPDQPGDVPITWANIDKAKELLGYQPTTSFEQGMWRFGEWIRNEVRDEAVA